jgi:hypothetical protein
MNHQEIDGVLQQLAGYYSNQPATQQQVKEFHRALAPLDADQVQVAVNAHIDTSPYRPKLADLLLRMGAAPAGVPTHECARCDGTGWVDVEAPPGAIAREHPWLEKCGACRGRGRQPGPRQASAREHLTDAQLTAMWAASDLCRREDGRIYRISTGTRVGVMGPERDGDGHYLLPPLPDGSRPAIEAKLDLNSSQLLDEIP